MNFSSRNEKKNCNQSILKANQMYKDCCVDAKKKKYNFCPKCGQNVKENVAHKVSICVLGDGGVSFKVYLKCI